MERQLVAIDDSVSIWVELVPERPVSADDVTLAHRAGETVSSWVLVDKNDGELHYKLSNYTGSLTLRRVVMSPPSASLSESSLEATARPGVLTPGQANLALSLSTLVTAGPLSPVTGSETRRPPSRQASIDTLDVVVEETTSVAGSDDCTPSSNHSAPSVHKDEDDDDEEDNISTLPDLSRSLIPMENLPLMTESSLQEVPPNDGSALPVRPSRPIHNLPREISISRLNVDDVDLEAQEQSPHLSTDDDGSAIEVTEHHVSNNRNDHHGSADTDEESVTASSVKSASSAVRLGSVLRVVGVRRYSRQERKASFLRSSLPKVFGSSENDDEFQRKPPRRHTSFDGSALSGGKGGGGGGGHSSGDSTTQGLDGGSEHGGSLASKMMTIPKALKTGFGFLDVAKKADDASTVNGDDDKSKSMLSSRARWDSLLMVSSLRRMIPKEVRAKRAQRKAALNSSSVEPTRLHELCGEPDVELSELQAELARSRDSASAKDAKGRLPLHILGDNDALVGSALGKATATTFSWQLMKIYPDAITTPDYDGYVPFVQLVKDWEKWMYESFRRKSNNVVSQGTRFMDRVAMVADKAGFTTSPMGRGSMTANMSESMKLTTSSRAFPPVEMWEEVDWCFEMLSSAMDELGGKHGGLHKKSRRTLDLLEQQVNTKDDDARTVLATLVVEVMPTILKTILLLEDQGGETRKRMLSMSLFRRILLCPESVGCWLTSMLRRKGLPSRRAIDYLFTVSQVTPEDLVGSYRSILDEDIIAFHDARETVFTALDDLEGTVASLVVLDERETERAATTPVLWHIMNKNLARPFVVSLVLIDFVLHIVLLLAFRADVSVINPLGEGTASIGQVPTRVVYFICFHYIIRKGCEAIALLSLSVSVFKGYLLNLWTLFDIIAIIMTLAAFIWNDAHPNQYRPGLNAFVLGLLWMKVLGFLKIVNKQMSTFILALIQIIRDLLFFMIVLMVIIFMFADMFRIAITTKDDGQFCNITSSTEPLEGPIKDFCSPDIADSYLRVYALLLGDFALDTYQETVGMTILFVIFTFIGVIILLNVLIAVISDSYERAKISSTLLFGRARVSFVAQNQALESFLQPGTNPVELLKGIKSPGKALEVTSRILRWCVLLTLVATAMSAEVFLVTQTIHSIRYGGSIFLNTIFMIVISAVLTSALWVLTFFALKRAVRGLLPAWARRIFDLLDRWNDGFVRFMARHLFGITRTVKHTPMSAEDDLDEEEEWTGRLTYMEKSFERSLDKATEDINTKMLSMEKRIYEHDEVQRQRNIKSKSLWQLTTSKMLASTKKDA